jgi:nucleoside-diphosphate-sugar epimerase
LLEFEAGREELVRFDFTGSCVLLLFSDVSAVVHAAARVYVMSEVEEDALTEHHKVIMEGAVRLA